MTELVALFASITALVSVLLGPLVSIWVAQKQARVSVLSGNRQAWINSLRDQIAEFISVLAVMHSANWTSRTDKDYDDEFKRILLLSFKVQLMLNPEEEDHKKLSDLLIAAQTTLSSAEGNNSTEGAKITCDIVPLAQSILKREWVRVKTTR